jgi:hypothetical protein
VTVRVIFFGISDGVPVIVTSVDSVSVMVCCELNLESVDIGDGVIAADVVTEPRESVEVVLQLGDTVSVCVSSRVHVCFDRVEEDVIDSDAPSETLFAEKEAEADRDSQSLSVFLGNVAEVDSGPVSREISV